MAAARLRRKYVGIEICERYVALAKKRIETEGKPEHVGGDSGPVAQQQSR